MWLPVPLPQPLAHVGWCCAEAAAERAVEMRDVSESDRERDRAYRLACKARIAKHAVRVRKVL